MPVNHIQRPWLNKKDLPSRSIILNDFQHKVEIPRK